MRILRWLLAVALCQTGGGLFKIAIVVIKTIDFIYFFNLSRMLSKPERLNLGATGDSNITGRTIMKTTNIIKTLVIAAGLFSGAAVAHGDRAVGSGHAASAAVQVLYDDPAYNRGIHSYPMLVPSVPIATVDMVYVDKANGQAIYSYPSNSEQ
ncbi:hypothetical protein A1507_06885 [Methylomonas koyamae]|uniref:Uncharacterized protein n=1 Tax=Methylomonas koyamae TaxID=702114 RepID=A0A177NN04_9GAMM|nr:hypothetical protein [Methylomonas koyamae]OAI19506.1 hypothetical protein A1507_06885 [Methylomonas koyamae]